jgi:tRNA dimethylallyltransferase
MPEKKLQKTKVVVICGPTACGKSALAVKLAKKYNGEIISADSRQVYIGLDIGTGKITVQEMKGIPHHMLDITSPKTRLTVEKYKTVAQKSIAEIIERGKLPIVCGGTGFYIEALIDNVIFPEVPPNEVLRKKLQKKSAETLFSILQKLDPRRAKYIDRKNIRRVIRAIEIASAIGKIPKIKKSSPYLLLFIGIDLPDNKLKKKIADRLHARISEGMIIEAKSLHKNGLSWKRMNELGLEYRYLALFLQKKITKDEFLKQLETEIWHYAKRQRTWFRKDKRIKWFKPTDFSAMEKTIKTFTK